MSLPNNSIDITSKQKKILIGLLRQHLPDTEVWAYGSRVKWTSKPASDLDLVAFTTPDQKIAAANLREAFEESNLPFRVDFFVWDEIPETFQEQIKDTHVVLQTGKGERRHLRMNDGLKDSQRDAIIGVLKNCPKLERARLFGSRAMGTFTSTSDVDIALEGDLSLSDQAKLSEKLERLTIPYKVDLVRVKEISSRALKEQIEQYGVVWYAREDGAEEGTTDGHGCTRMGGASGGAVRSKWKLLTWGNLATLEYGKALRDYQEAEGKVPVYGTNGAIGWTKKPLRNEPGVVIGRKGAYRGVHFSDKPFFVIDTAFYLKPKQNLNIRWAYYQLLNLDINGMDSGSAIPSTSRDEFYQLPVLVPPLKEQDSIAHILKTLDDKIALNRKLNATLEGMARALFQSWFVDFDPVKAKLAGVRHGRDPERACMAALSGKLRIPPGKPKPDLLDQQLPSAEELDIALAALDDLPPAQLGKLTQTAAHFPSGFQESELGLVPEGWEVGTLNDLCSLNEESWTGRKHPEKVHYVDLANCKNGYILSVTEYDWDDAPSRARRVLKAGDSIVGTVRPGNRSFALIGESEKQLTGSTGFAVLSPTKAIFQEFVYLQACGDENIARLTHLADGAAYPAVRPDVVSNYEILIPPEALLKAFSTATSGCFGRRSCNEYQSRTLAELRDTLLPKLLSGELSVGEAILTAEGTETL